MGVPYIPTHGEADRRKRWLKRVLIAATIAVVLLLVLLHFLYLPLDVLMMKLLARFD